MTRVKLDSWLQLGKALRNKTRAENMMEKAGTKVRCTKDSDSNPSMVSRDVLEDTAIVAGELATRKRSVGSNKSTQRAIHHKTLCTKTFVNGQTQRRKGKVTTSP